MTSPTLTTCGGLLGLHAQTALHPGAGTALGTVDLPVQRERHTHWPNIAGSALKGILRDVCRARVARRDDLDQLPRFDDRPAEGDRPAEPAKREGSSRKRADATLLLNSVFGPPTGGSAEFAGALSVTDARLLAFPVRSLKGVFAWATCPMALDRLRRDAALANMNTEWPVSSPGANQAVLASDSPCLVGQQLVLEEFDFTRIDGDVAPVAGWIATDLLPQDAAYEATRVNFSKRFVILHDDDFTHFVQHATEISARIGLNYDTKTVKEGAPFYQEFLPAETLFYAVVLANAARARQGSLDAGQILDFVVKHLPPVLQIGGDETTGKGYCATRLAVSTGGN